MCEDCEASVIKCHNCTTDASPTPNSLLSRRKTLYFYFVGLLVILGMTQGLQIFSKQYPKPIPIQPIQNGEIIPHSEESSAEMRATDTKYCSAVPASDTTDPRPLTELGLKQLERFRRGQGLLLNLHLSHHAGTSFCKAFGQHSPSFACMGVRKADKVDGYYPRHKPWNCSETDLNIPIVRKYFTMISWEFSNPPSNGGPALLEETNWEHPDLVSVFIIRDPMTRLLAGDGVVQRKFPGVLEGKANRTEFMAYASSPKYTNNFNLRVLSGHGCCQGEETDEAHLERAKHVIRRMTVVLDIDCLEEGFQELGRRLGVGPVALRTKRTRIRRPSVKERIGFDDVYEFLLRRNHLDIKFYQWAKQRSLVDCSTV